MIIKTTTKRPDMTKFIFSVHLFITYLALSCSTLANEPVTIHVGVLTDAGLLTSYTEATHNKPCNEIDTYAYSNSTRTYTESLLICQALRLGGINPKFKFIEFPTEHRLLKSINEGKLHMMFSSTWLEDINPEKVFYTDAIIDKGSFEKGIYTLPEHKKLLAVKNLEELTKYSALSNQSYHADWAALKQMDIRTYSVHKWPLMFKMLQAGRADFLLAEFSPHEDMAIYTDDIKVIPVANMKIVLNSSRHVIVNKSLASAEVIFNALQSGLAKLKQQGVVNKAYKELGLFDPRVKNWKILCCKPQ